VRGSCNMAKALPEKLITLLKEVNLTERQAVWDCHGTPVVLHKALEKVAAHHKIVFDQPKIIETDVSAKFAVICVTGHMADATEWSIGEAAPYNNKNSYPFAMAEKRAKDRVILKLVGLHGDVYSEEEADDFKNAKPNYSNSETKITDIKVADLDQKVEAAISFYQNCNKQRFLEFENRYNKLLNMIGLEEHQYQEIMETHDKRKEELKI